MQIKIKAIKEMKLAPHLVLPLNYMEGQTWKPILKMNISFNK